MFLFSDLQYSILLIVQTLCGNSAMESQWDVLDNKDTDHTLKLPKKQDSCVERMSLFVIKVMQYYNHIKGKHLNKSITSLICSYVAVWTVLIVIPLIPVNKIALDPAHLFWRAASESAKLKQGSQTLYWRQTQLFVYSLGIIRYLHCRCILSSIWFSWRWSVCLHLLSQSTIYKIFLAPPPLEALITEISN